MGSWIVRCRYMGEICISHQFVGKRVAALSWDTGRTSALNQSLLNYDTFQELRYAVQEAYPQYPNRWDPDARVFWQFSREVRRGDLVVTNPSPCIGPNPAPIRLGRCSRSYYFLENACPWGQYDGDCFRFQHRIEVIWLGGSIRRDELSREVNRKMGRGRTVVNLRKYGAELEILFERLRRSSDIG